MNMYYIIGLGNIGERYEGTRHNVGFMTLDSVRDRWGFESWQKDSYVQAHISCGEVNGRQVVLVKPDTYMNNSGRVIPELRKRGLEIERCVLIHDEIDLPLGIVKINSSKGHGGHRGVRSVMEALDSKDILRARIGVLPHLVEVGQIKRVGGKSAVKSFILGRFNEEERGEIEGVFERARVYLETFLKEGREKVISSCTG